MTAATWLAVRKELPQRPRRLLAVASFLLPLLIWSLVSYVPWLWHPMVLVHDAGDVSYFRTGQLVEKETFTRELIQVEATGGTLPTGAPANPIYLPAPHEVITAMYNGEALVGGFDATGNVDPAGSNFCAKDRPDLNKYD